jgi:hypothetical protein
MLHNLGKPFEPCHQGEAPTRGSKWTTEEGAKLIDAVTKCGKDWVAVAALVSGRTNIQCHNRWANHVNPTINGKNRMRGPWTSEEDAKLIDAVAECEIDLGKDWVAVAAVVPGRTNNQCCKRWATHSVSIQTSPGRTGKWTAEEVAKLTTAIEKHDNDWVTVIPAAKRPRLQTSIPTSADAVVDTHTTDTVITPSPDDMLVVTARDKV